MAKVGINTGSAANAGDGSALRAGGNIINANFDEIYEYLGDGTTLDADLGGKWLAVSTGINTLSNIGIGTTNPWNALTVLGNASITGVTTSSGGFSGDITGSLTGDVYNTGISTFQDVLVSGASTVTGKSTFTGIGTFSSDLYVGGNLYTLGDITYDEVNGRNISVTGIGTIAYLGVTDLNVSGFSTFSGLSTTGSDLYIGDSLYVSQDATVTGVVTATTFAGNLTGTPTLGTGVTVYSSGIVSATTFVGDLTGNPTGSAAGLTAVPGGQLTGTLAAVNGSSLSGIVTSLTAGSNISVSGATGAVTITGLANTAIVSANTLNVSGVSTFVGEAQFNTGLVPDADEGAYLGSQAKPWSAAYIGEIRIADGGGNDPKDNEIDTVSGNLELDSAGGTVIVDDDLSVSGGANITGGLTVAGAGLTATFEGNIDLTGNNNFVNLPSLTTTERTNATSMRAGSLIFNETTGTLEYYNGSAWRAVDNSAV